MFDKNLWNEIKNQIVCKHKLGWPDFIILNQYNCKFGSENMYMNCSPHNNRSKRSRIPRVNTNWSKCSKEIFFLFLKNEFSTVSLNFLKIWTSYEYGRESSPCVSSTPSIYCISIFIFIYLFIQLTFIPPIPM